MAKVTYSHFNTRTRKFTKPKFVCETPRAIDTWLQVDDQFATIVIDGDGSNRAEIQLTHFEMRHIFEQYNNKVKS